MRLPPILPRHRGRLRPDPNCHGLARLATVRDIVAGTLAGRNEVACAPTFIDGGTRDLIAPRLLARFAGGGDGGGLAPCYGMRRVTAEPVRRPAISDRLERLAAAVHGRGRALYRPMGRRASQLGRGAVALRVCGEAENLMRDIAAKRDALRDSFAKIRQR